MSSKPNLSLKRLVKKSVLKNTNKKVFASLLAQLCDSDSVSDNELVDSLLDLLVLHNLPPTRGRRAELLHVEFVLEYFSSSGVKMAKFFALLEQLSYASQKRYIMHLKGRFMTELRPDLAQEFIRCFSNYTLSLSQKTVKADAEIPAELKSLWYDIVFMWGAIIECDYSQFSSPSFKEVCMAVMKALNLISDPALSALYLGKVNSAVNPSDRASDFPELESTTRSIHVHQAPKAQALSLTSKRFATYIRFKKVLWLHSQFQAWTFNADLLPRYMSFFSLSAADPGSLVHDVVCSFLDGMLFALATDVRAYVRFNWKNYITSRLPLQLRNIAKKPLSKEQAEKLIQAVLDYDQPSIAKMTVGGVKTPYDLRREFLKCCAYKDLITYEQYISAFAIERENYSLSLFEQETETLDRVVNISAEFNSKLMNLNTEFTSLRESRFVEFLQKLPHSNFCYLEIQQKKLTYLIVKLVNQLIKERNNEKLSRLMLALLNSLTVANYLFFNDSKGPWYLLELLVTYIDEGQFSVDEDDGNFQEMYASFGVILSGAICVSDFFNVDFCTLNIKNSYTVDFINKFFYRLGDTFTFALQSENEEENTIASNFETLSTNWANALFDVNNEGLSDDLIKSVNVKQIYKFIFIIFKQAIMSRAVGGLSENSLNNGIDYLSQNFLVPCTLGVMKWVLTHIGVNQASSELMLSILIKIIDGFNASESSSNASGPDYVSKMILNLMGPDIVKRLESLSKGQAGEKAAKLLEMIKSTVDSEYCNTESSGSHVSTNIAMSKSIREDVGQLVKKHDSLSILQILQLWASISARWNILPDTELFEALLREEGKWFSHQKSGLDDETKAILDFQMFMTVSVSHANHEELLKCYEQSKSGSRIKLSQADVPKQFVSNSDDHISSIFEEPIKPEDASDTFNVDTNMDRNENSDLMTDFVMDDLFNEVAENVFDERELDRRIGLDQKDSPGRESKTTNIETTYEHLRFRSTKLMRILDLMDSNPYEENSELAISVRERLSQEMSHWKQTQPRV